jgi:hypothetical protein
MTSGASARSSSAEKLLGISVKATGIARPAVVDPHVAAVGPAELLQSLLESRGAAPAFRIVRGHVHQHANTPHPLRPLRVRGERPCCRRAPEQGDELASLQPVELHQTAPSQQVSITDWRPSSQGLAALRDLDPAYDGFGSKARITAPQHGSLL